MSLTLYTLTVWLEWERPLMLSMYVFSVHFSLVNFSSLTDSHNTTNCFSIFQLQHTAFHRLSHSLCFTIFVEHITAAAKQQKHYKTIADFCLWILNVRYIGHVFIHTQHNIWNLRDILYCSTTVQFVCSKQYAIACRQVITYLFNFRTLDTNQIVCVTKFDFCLLHLVWC